MNLYCYLDLVFQRFRGLCMWGWRLLTADRVWIVVNCVPKATQNGRIQLWTEQKAELSSHMRDKYMSMTWKQAGITSVGSPGFLAAAQGGPVPCQKPSRSSKSAFKCLVCCKKNLQPKQVRTPIKFLVGFYGICLKWNSIKPQNSQAGQQQTKSIRRVEPSRQKLWRTTEKSRVKPMNQKLHGFLCKG